MALREQNAHIQRKVASGEGGDDLLEGGDSQQKLHGKVSLSSSVLKADLRSQSIKNINNGLVFFACTHSIKFQQWLD